MRGWGFYINLTGRPAAWIASVVFVLVGILIALWLPLVIQTTSDREFATWLLRILGATFFVLGALTFLWLVVDWFLGQNNSPHRETWFWWGNFLAGMIGAGLFALPATLTAPFFLLAYLFRPNAIFPANSPDVGNNLFVSAIFSIAGIGALALMYFVGKTSYRQRPTPSRGRAHHRAAKR